MSALSLHVGCSPILPLGQNKKRVRTDKAAQLSVIEYMNIEISFDAGSFLCNF